MFFLLTQILLITLGTEEHFVLGQLEQFTSDQKHCHVFDLKFGSSFQKFLKH